MFVEPQKADKLRRQLSTRRVRAAKRSFVTRRADLEVVKAIDANKKPAAGDLCLARLVRKGQHQRIELPDGRRARMHEGDELILAYGNRYASDQFHAVVPEHAGTCQMVAAGGIAAHVLHKNSNIRQATIIESLGTLCREDGSSVNLRDFALDRTPMEVTPRTSVPVIVILGSGMNAGKTTSVCDVVRAFGQSALNASVIKVTGTGAGGDIWQYQDSGADSFLDFTDAGHASTMGLDLAELDQIMLDLHQAASRTHPDVIIVEIADGLLQRETHMLLRSEVFRTMVSSIVLAVGDPLAAMGGAAFLRELHYEIAAFMGRISSSPLFVSELEQALPTPVLTSDRLFSDERALAILMQSAHRDPSGESSAVA